MCVLKYYVACSLNIENHTTKNNTSLDKTYNFKQSVLNFINFSLAIVNIVCIVSNYNKNQVHALGLILI